MSLRNTPRDEPYVGPHPEDDGFITIHPPVYGKGLVEDMQKMQREMLDEIRRVTGIAADYSRKPELTATQVMLQERIAAQSKAYAEDVLRGLAKFMAANPGARPVLKTWYDDETKTIRGEWTGAEPKP